MASATDALGELWTKHRSGVLQQLGVVENAVTELIAGDLDEPVRALGQREAHKLAGSLGTFGFRKASELARTIELTLSNRAALGPNDVPALARALAGIRADLDDDPLPAEGAEPATPVAGRAPFVLVVDDDEALAGRVAAEALRRGMRSQSASSPAAAAEIVAGDRPDVVMLDLSFPEGVGPAYDLLSDLAAHTPPVPVVALTVSDAFADRVEVARRGGSGFLHKSLSPGQTIDAVVRLLERSRAAQTTLLAVDDDPVILESLVALLEPLGMQVTTLNDPARFWDALEEVSPDLVVLDFDMPGLSGVELCRVLRNDARWGTVPVVFLTARRDAESIQGMFAAGADDYVAKPIVPAELETRIKNRLERSQLQRALAETDTLTGVMNRRSASDKLAQLMRLAERYDQPLSLATLDLDRFKAVNDRYGHATGDAVLVRLGELLQRCFRGEDVAARWGGEEFVVGMYGMSRDDGVRRMSELLERFRQEEFSAGLATLSMTFSAGVAQYPEDGADLRSLLQATDDALYAAKEGGRATVLPAQGRTGVQPAPVDVAIVEDDDVLAAVLEHALGTEGLRTHRISEGDSAAAVLAGHVPEVPARVILLDVDLPGLDGLSILRRLAIEGTLRRTRAIMLTARSSEAEVVEALELGAFDHIAKPFSVPVLLHKVRRALGD